VRSAVSVSLSGAQVFVVAGNVQLKTLKDTETVLRSAGVAFEVARPVTGETPPELGKLSAGDLVATLPDAPAGKATPCPSRVAGDWSDPEFRAKTQKHLDEIEVRCVPLPPDTHVTTIEVPPMKRFE